MLKDLITVIVPTYNAESFLLDRSAKVLEQNYGNIEFIFIDDCSSDNTWLTLQKLKEDNPLKNIKIYRNENNLGPALTRNRSINLASGKYIFFCDSDDIADPSLLSKAHAVIERDQSDLVVFAYEVVGKDFTKQYPIPSELLNAKTVEDIRGLSIHLSYSSCDKLISRDFLLKHNITFPNIRFGEDMCWTMKVLQHANKVSFLNEYLYQYIMTENSLSSGKHALDMIECYKINRNTFEQFHNKAYLLHELLMHLIDTYKNNFQKISAEQQVNLAKALFALPEIQNLEQEILGYSLWEKHPFYKLIPKGAFKVRDNLKTRYSEFKRIKFVLDTKSLLH